VGGGDDGGTGSEIGVDDGAAGRGSDGGGGSSIISSTVDVSSEMGFEIYNSLFLYDLLIAVQ